MVVNFSTKQRFSSAVHLPAVEGYDLIGDIHGCAVTLERLLQQLDYRKVRGVYQHASRRVVFLGDVIDRGPRIREALLLVHSMVERGSAEIVLGNHELNALLYFTKAKDTSEYLRSHTPSNTQQLEKTLEQFSNYPKEWDELLAWFERQPLFLEFANVDEEPVFRAVHACWDAALIAEYRAKRGSAFFDKEFLHACVVPGSLEYRVRQRLTLGVDMPLPEGVRVISSDGYERFKFRTKFWAQNAQTYGDLLFQPDPIPAYIAESMISDEHRQLMINYAASEPPLFVGHYWLKGHPEALTANIACLDYSAVKYGKLVSYRMDGEAQLMPHKFVWEYVDP